ncbi:MAG: CBS domain-containing protein [Candidatus Omnitrophota bacterium]
MLKLNDIIVLVKYKNIHTLPVIEGSKLVGIIGRYDIIKNFYSIVESLKVTNVPPKKEPE